MEIPLLAIFGEIWPKTLYYSTGSLARFWTKPYTINIHVFMHVHVHCTCKSMKFTSPRFTDKLTLTIIGGISYTVSLSAEGKGTTIVSVPSMHSSVNMGTHFACSQVRKQFTLTNRGRRSQVYELTRSKINF